MINIDRQTAKERERKRGEKEREGEMEAAFSIIYTYKIWMLHYMHCQMPFVI